MSSTQIRANLFGSFTLYRGENQLDILGSASARALLAYLLLHRGQPQSRLRIAGIFWPDMDEARSRRSLTQALWRIRNVLPELIDSDAQLIQISESADLWTDIDTFEKLAGESADPAGLDALALQQAIELYRGDLLEGIYDDWVFMPRERLRE